MSLRPICLGALFALVSCTQPQPPPTVLKDAGVLAAEPQPAVAFTTEELTGLALRPGGPGAEVIEAEDGGVLGVVGRLSANDSDSSSAGEAALAFLRERGAEVWGWKSADNDVAILDAEREAVPVSKTSSGGTVTLEPVLVSQRFKKLPIEGREASILIASHDAEGGLVVGAYFGSLGPEPDPAINGALSAEPAMKEAEVFAKVTSDPRLVNYDMAPPGKPSWRHRALRVWRESDGGGPLRLCYRLLTAPDDTSGLRLRLLADANTGELLEVQEDTPSELHDVTTVVYGPALAQTSSPRTVPMLQDGALYALAAHVPSGRGLFGVYHFHDFFLFEGLMTSATPDFTGSAYAPIAYATEAYLNAPRTLDYFWREFRWNSWDGRGADLELGVDFRHPLYGTSWNAYGGGGHIYFTAGLRPGLQPSGVSGSVLSHEFFHNVLEAANPLTYWGESGALNEAFADLAGQSVRDWSSDVVSNECSSDGLTGIRNMSNPPAYGQPQRYADLVRTTDDSGGVHTNSGIVNKAHALMTKGSGPTGAFEGYVINGFDPRDLPRSSRLTSHLVVSAILGRHFPPTTSLRNYGAGLYAWCQSQTALFASQGSSAEAGCGVVHDALAATGLIPHTSYPVDLVMTQVQAQLGYRLSEDGRYLRRPNGVTRLSYRLANRGSTTFNGPLVVEARSQDGTVSFGTDGSDGVFVGPDRESEEQVFHVNLASLIPMLPAELVLRLDAGDRDSTPFNNLVRIPISAEPIPYGEVWSFTANSGRLELRISQTGNVPLRSGDVAARFLYRASMDGPFSYPPGTPEQRLSPDQVTDSRASTAVLNLTETLPTTLHGTLPTFTVSMTRPISLDGIPTPRVTLGSDGQLRDGAGTVIPGPVLLAVFNTDLHFRASPSSNVIFCLNCQRSGGLPDRGHAIVRIDGDAPIGQLFPKDLQPLLERVQSPKTKPAVARYMYPGFAQWFTSVDGPDPAVIKRAEWMVNPGP